MDARLKKKALLAYLESGKAALLEGENPLSAEPDAEARDATEKHRHER